MPFKKGQPGGPGRPKNSKSKITKDKEARLAEAAATVLVSGKVSHAKKFPRKGPSPKDLLLDTMRGAYAAANARSAEAAALERAAALLPQGPEREGMLRDAAAAKMNAGVHLSHATELAKDVAPYEHAKLVSKDTTVSGTVIVKIKRYSDPVPV
jgi:hypothetical protein